MRAAAALFGILLASCGTPAAVSETAVEPAKSAAPSSSHEPDPPFLTAVLFDPASTQARIDAIVCTVERVPGNAPPPGLVLQRTSPDGANRIWGDRADSCGGDHNVFGEVDCIFDPDVRTAAVTTAEAAYLMQSNSPLGMFVAHRNTGEVVCSAMRPRKDPSDIGPLRHHVSGETPEPTEFLVLNSALLGECLGFLDDAGEPLVAVLPAALDAFHVYNSLDDAPIYIEGDTGRIRRMGTAQRVWTLPVRIGVEGHVLALPEPLPRCDGAARAVFLRDMPEIQVHGLRYPHPPRDFRRPL